MAHLERYFFAVRPPISLARQILAYAEGFGLAPHYLSPDRLHLTLAITKDFDAIPHVLVDAMLEAGAQITAAPFAIWLDRLTRGHMSGGRAQTVLRPGAAIPALKKLDRDIHNLLAPAEPLLREKRFSPHVTLCYGQGAPFHRPVREFGWEVDEVVLIRSLVGRTQHEELGRWALRGPPAPAPARSQQLELF